MYVYVNMVRGARPELAEVTFVVVGTVGSGTVAV
jgi:hypothetical protein